MKLAVPILIVAVTVALAAVGILAPGGFRGTVGIASGSAVPGMMPAAHTPEEAIVRLLVDVQKRSWKVAHSQLANSGEVDEGLFTQALSGNNGSLRTFSSLQSWELRPLHATNDQALVRCTLQWSTPVGPIQDMQDLEVLRQGNTWKVVWPAPHFPGIPAQVIPVNYLRWDLVVPSSADEWGERNLDSPHVRIVSMNAVDYQDGTVVMGEVVNEDTVPAFVNVNAVLVDGTGKSIDEESSFDKIAHVLLPKQVSPYRIDFPSVGLAKVKNVRMDVKATLVPASADPVIGVMSQTLDSDASGRKVLHGQLLNQSGQTVNIPHVIATFYDNTGKVIWVSDGYVDRALYPQSPEPFAVEVPGAVADRVHNYHVVVNQYSLGRS